MQLKVNLVQYLFEVLEEYKKFPTDVKWVGTSDGRFARTWQELDEIKDDFDYNEMYLPDTVIVGEGWYLSYDEKLEEWKMIILPFLDDNCEKFNIDSVSPPSDKPNELRQAIYTQTYSQTKANGK